MPKRRRPSYIRERRREPPPVAPEPQYPYLEEFGEKEPQKPLWQYPIEFLGRAVEQISTMGGAIATAPFRDVKPSLPERALGPLASLAKFYPGGREYKAYEKYKEEYEPAETLFPSWEQVGAWLKPALGVSPTLRKLTEKWEEPEEYQRAKIGTPEIAEWLPWLASMGLVQAPKTALQFIQKTALGQLGKGKTAEESIKIATRQAIKKGKVPAYPTARMIQEAKPPPVKPTAKAAEPLKQAVIETDATIEKLTVLFTARKPARAAIEIIKKEVRGVRAGKLEEIAQTAKTPEEFLRRSGKALTGKYAKPPVFEALPEGALSAKERELILNHITNNPLFYEDQYGKFRMVKLVFDDLMKGGVPTRGEFKSLERVFGWDMADAVKRHGTMEKAWRIFMDVTGMPKAIKATADLSYTFRQVIFAGAGHPKTWGKNFWGQVRALFSQSYYDDAMVAVRAHPEFKHALKIGKVEFTQFGKGKGLGLAEEAFPTRFADVIPILKQVSRAATFISNKMRFDIYYSYRAKMGNIVPDEGWRALGSILNAATGRGEVPRSLVPAFTLLNRILFSPRFALTPFQMVYFPLRHINNPLVRRFALRSWMGFMGLNISLLGLGKATGLWDVELDPTSSNFGRARIGDVRFDLWHGYLPWVRLMARLVKGTTHTETGEIRDVKRMDMTIHTVRGKLDPITAVIWDLMEGRSYIGEEFPPKEEDLPEAMRDRLLPMAVNDVWDAYMSDGIMGATVGGVSALLGANAAAYPARIFDQWADWVANKTGKDWTYEQLQAIRIDFNEANEDWQEYMALPRGKTRDYYVEKNPKIDASLYFWGEKKTFETTEARQIFNKMAQDAGVPSYLWPIRDIFEEYEKEGKKPDEMLADMIQLVPQYWADAVHGNREYWLGQDLAMVINRLQAVKEKDQLLLNQYEEIADDPRIPADKRTMYRQLIRERRPDIDVALNIWGHATTVKSVKAYELLKAKAQELGIPFEALPAIQKVLEAKPPTTRQKGGARRRPPYVK